MKPSAYDRFAGGCSVLAGISGFLYAVAFIVLRSSSLSALFLLLTGMLATAALVALYDRLRATEAPFALWALILGIAGAVGSAVHGGYDLANAINPPGGVNADLPSQVDPRGLLTFGAAGLALWAFSWLITKRNQLPRGLAYVGYLSGVLSIVLYLARLIVLSPTSPIILVLAIVNGFVANPLWYIWLGAALWLPRRT